MSRKNKNIILLISFIAALWVTYIFAISISIDARKEYYKLQTQKKGMTNMPHRLNYLEQQKKYLDSLLRKNNIKTESTFQNNLLQHIETYTNRHDLKIVSFNEPHQFINDHDIIKTYSFSVKGIYTNILQLIHNLEQNGNYGNLISINFEKTKNYKLNKTFLECEILLQKVNRN